MIKIFTSLLLLALNLTVYAQEVPALLTAKFNQGEPFNNSCPNGCVTGCGPTAIAEILNFYKLPAHGYGIAPLVMGSDTIQVDMETLVFHWNQILDQYNPGEYTETQAKAVADLMYACGVAMNVKYGSSTSVTNYARMLYGLQHNLHISPESRYLHRKNFSTSEWIEILNTQLQNGHPVFYRGTWFFGDSRADHMFVVDGLDAEGDYHVNFGHGGANDKFCNINVINQSGTFPGNRGVCYNASQAMVINCFPTPECTDYPLQASVSEEPIILNGDIFLESEEIPLGESFTLSCRLRSCSREKSTITFGWALIKDGETIEILGQHRYGLSPGNTFMEASHRTLKLPAGLEDGNYELVLYSKSNLEDVWREAWRDAETTVEVSVKNGMATITVPPSHKLNPELYLTDEITEVKNDFASSVAGRCFQLPIANSTVNNFENLIKLEVTADGETYSYKTTIPVYSQTNTTFQILIPNYMCNLEGKSITSVKASYYFDLEDTFIDMPIKDPTQGVESIYNLQTAQDLHIFDISGRQIGMVKASEISTSYQNILHSLPHGVYVIKEGTKTRKILVSQ